MSNRDVGGKGRGVVESSIREQGLLGRIMEYPNFGALTDKNPRDYRPVWMMWVLNGESSAALLPGQLVAPKTTFGAAIGNTTVVNPAATAGVYILGVVDHLLPAAGCPAGSYCLITVLGPTKMLLDANATSAEFDNLLNSASIAGAVRSGTHGAAGSCGRNEAAGTTAAGSSTLATCTSFWGFFGKTMGQ